MLPGRIFTDTAAERPMPALVARLVLVGACAAGATGCGARYIRSTSAPPTQQMPAASVSRHVVVVSIDGLRPDAIEAYGAPRCSG